MHHRWPERLYRNGFLLGIIISGRLFRNGFLVGIIISGPLFRIGGFGCGGSRGGGLGTSVAVRYSDAISVAVAARTRFRLRLGFRIWRRSPASASVAALVTTRIGLNLFYLKKQARPRSQLQSQFQFWIQPRFPTSVNRNHFRLQFVVAWPGVSRSPQLQLRTRCTALASWPGPRTRLQLQFQSQH